MPIDIFNTDAFSLVSLTARINNMDHVPSRAGQVAFSGVGDGVPTTTIAVEEDNETLSLIPTSPRGGPAPQNSHDKGKLHNISVPQLKLEDSMPVASVQNVRELGSEDELRGVERQVDRYMRKMLNRHDMTLEYHRLGALKGVILDSDGSTLLNLYTALGVTQEATVNFKPALNPSTETETFGLREVAQGVVRTMRRRLKGMWPQGAMPYAFCGDNFFDYVTGSDAVDKSVTGYDRAMRILGDNYAHGVFEFGGVMWENYQGTDDNSTVAIDTNECQLFPINVPGLYVEYFAPADFAETVNTIGLPRYARVAPDGRFNRSIELHTQQNPLPLCLKPGVLIKGTVSP